MEIDISNHKLMYHPKRVAEWKEKEDCYPLYIEIGLTNSCNHRCIFCALDFLENKGCFINKEISWQSIARKLENLMAKHDVERRLTSEKISFVDRLAREEALKS